jgi:protein TonB
MSTSRIVREPRHAAILATIFGLHVGVAVLVVNGHPPRLEWLKPPPTMIFVLPKAQEPPPVAPRQPEPVDYGLPHVPQPLVPIPDFKDSRTPLLESRATAGPETTTGSDVSRPDVRGPSLRTRDSRLAALIDACYPSASRRLDEEGRVVIHVRVGASGRVVAWNIVERSGFARLDAAADCVVRRLEFNPGRRDGAAVEASALLPIVFRLD